MWKLFTLICLVLLIVLTRRVITNMKQLLLLMILLMGSTATFAQGRTVFLCTSASGKQIVVSQIGNSYQYQFGRPGRPELVFRNSVREVDSRYEDRTGQGSYNSSGLMLKNGSYYYYVYTATHRMTLAEESGVIVTQGRGSREKYITTVVCSQQRPIYINW